MKSIISLPPVLQEVWSRVYAATVQGVHASNVKDDPLHSGEPESMAERAAWEAVRRANGGEMPGEPSKVDDKTWKRSAMRDALLWFADEANYVGLPRQQTGIEKAREALGVPCRHEDGALIPLAEALTHSATIGPNVDEPTDEEMIEALAPIIASVQAVPLTANDDYGFYRREATRALRGEPVDKRAKHCAAIAIASWKAARAWGRK